MKPYSKDLRLRVLAAVDRGMPRKEVAKTFGVSLPTIKRYLKRRRQPSEVEPKPITGAPARKGAALDAALPQQVRLNPDLTLDEHCELFEEVHSLGISNATMSRAFKRLGLPLKKVALFLGEGRRRASALARAPKANSSRAAGVRGRMRHPHLHDSPLRPSTQRRVGLRKRPDKPRQEHHCACQYDALWGMGKAMAVEGSTTKAVFEAYIEEFLASSLWPGQVVILDNLGAHKSERVKELIEARGAPRLPTRLLAGLQSHRGSLLEDQGLLLKKAAARTREALVEAIAAALRAITSEDARGWFGNCGYEFEAQDL